MDEKAQPEEDHPQHATPSATQHLALGRFRLCSPLHFGRALEAGVLHVAGVHISTLRNHFQHDKDMEGPISVPYKGMNTMPAVSSWSFQNHRTLIWPGQKSVTKQASRLWWFRALDGVLVTVGSTHCCQVKGVSTW